MRSFWHIFGTFLADKNGNNSIIYFLPIERFVRLLAFLEMRRLV